MNQELLTPALPLLQMVGGETHVASEASAVWGCGQIKGPGEGFTWHLPLIAGFCVTSRSGGDFCTIHFWIELPLEVGRPRQECLPSKSEPYDKRQTRPLWDGTCKCTG